MNKQRLTNIYVRSQIFFYILLKATIQSLVSIFCLWCLMWKYFICPFCWKQVIQSTVTTSCLWCLHWKPFLCVHKNRVVSIAGVQFHYFVSISSYVVSFVVSYVVSTGSRLTKNTSYLSECQELNEKWASFWNFQPLSGFFKDTETSVGYFLHNIWKL